MAETVLKNRIVGMVIVIALAVIILPELFSNAGEQSQDTFQVTPLRPAVESEMAYADFPEDFTLNETEKMELVESETTIDTEASQLDALEREVRTTEATPSKENPSTQIKLDEPHEQWVIQLGVFRDKKRAETLVNKLKVLKYPAYIRLGSGSQGAMHYVLVGPELNKEVLSKQLKKIQQETSEKGVIKPYRPAAE